MPVAWADLHVEHELCCQDLWLPCTTLPDSVPVRLITHPLSKTRSGGCVVLVLPVGRGAPTYWAFSVNAWSQGRFHVPTTVGIREPCSSSLPVGIRCHPQFNPTLAIRLRNSECVV